MVVVILYIPDNVVLGNYIYLHVCNKWQSPPKY